MKRNTRRFAAIVGIGLALLMPINRAFALSESLEQLSAEWCQWAFSIPTPVNPLSDADGRNAAVGQRALVWFLAGVAGPGGTVTRQCSVPGNSSLFFPIINLININTPNACGQGGTLTVSELRAQIAPFIDQAVKIKATLDNRRIKNLQRVQSTVFAATFPEDNEFDVACGSNVPAGVYSPGVADGYYVLLDPPSAGEHTLHFHAEITTLGLTEDVTYRLTVVPVVLQ
jgi:hypothetical protein